MRILSPTLSILLIRSQPPVNQPAPIEESAILLLDSPKSIPALVGMYENILRVSPIIRSIFAIVFIVLY